MRTREYKGGKFLICLYNIINKEGDVDECIAVFDNMGEFADFADMKLNTAKNIVLNHKKRGDNKIWLHNKWLELRLVRA